MKTNTSVFNFQNHQLNTHQENDNIWFLAIDVCKVLGYSNPRDAVKRHCKEKGVVKRYTPTSGGQQEMVYINEPNLYRLIIKSKQPNALQFEEWVMEEVLPTIRKTGSYSKSQLALPLYDKDEITVNRTNLICLVSHMLWLSRFYREQRFYEIFQLLGSNYGVRMHDHFGDGAFVAGMFKRQIEKELKDPTLFNQYI